MRRRYVGVIVDALGILQRGCRGHLFGTRKTGRQPDVSSRPKVTRRSVSRGRRPTRTVAVAGSLMATEPVRPHRSEENTMQAMMDLALPRCEGFGDGPRQVHRPWMVSTELPDPGCSTDLLR